MNDIKNEYRCVTDLVEVKAYLGAAKIVSFDYETAPDDGYRAEDKAALDAAKSHICTLSLSVREHTGIMIPVAHKVGPNMPKAEFDAFLMELLTAVLSRLPITCPSRQCSPMQKGSLLCLPCMTRLPHRR